MTSSREQFEGRYPIPEGVTWDDREQRYKLDPKFGSVRRWELYVSFWLVWRTSWESAESTMHPFKPADEPQIAYTGCVICGQYTDHQGLPCPKRMAFASADLRVSP